MAVTLAKQRLMTALYDYYELAHPDEGVGSGFVYETAPHISLSSIANNPDIREGMTRAEIDAAIARHAPRETLRDQPKIDASRKRVSGPFTVEAVPALFAQSVDELVESAGVEEMDEEDAPPQWGVARSGEASRQEEWRGELAKTGIRGRGGQLIRFARLEALPALRYLHADGHALPEEGDGDAGRRVVVSFGPDHAPLEHRQVEQAVQEARTLVPPPEIVVFAAFQFDAEAAKDIDETRWPNAALLEAQMNADLLTGDLKKKRASNESFWLVGQPDVEVETIAEGPVACLNAFDVDLLVPILGHYLIYHGLFKGHNARSFRSRRDDFDLQVAGCISEKQTTFQSNFLAGIFCFFRFWNQRHVGGSACKSSGFTIRKSESN